MCFSYSLNCVFILNLSLSFSILFLHCVLNHVFTYCVSCVVFFASCFLHYIFCMVFFALCFLRYDSYVMILMLSFLYCVFCVITLALYVTTVSLLKSELE